MEQLCAQDASFVYLETPNTPMHIGSINIYDPSTAPGGKVRFKQILAHIESRVPYAKGFREKLVRVPFDLDHPYWINDANFDIEYHVRHLALPQPGDWRQLCIQAARLHARPMDLSRPLWEMTIVEGLDNIPGIPKGSFAMVCKAHHALIDGMSGVELTSVIHDLAPGASPRGEARNWNAETSPDMGEMLFRTWLGAMRRPAEFTRTMWQTAPGIARLSRDVLKGDVSLSQAAPAPRTIFNGKVGPHRVIDGAVLPLDGVRAIKNSLPGATVNDAILTIIGGGLRAYLLSRDALPAEPLKAMAPISVRADDQKASLGNQVSAMIADLGTHIEDPLARLAHVHGGTQRSKALTNAVGARTLTELGSLAPGALVGLGARLYTRFGVANSMSSLFNCTATNVPGSPVPLYLAGAQMVRTIGFGPLFDGMGLINTIYSYGGEIVISFTSDRNIMPDPSAYAAGLHAAYDALLAAIGAPGKTAKAPKPAPAETTKTKTRAKAAPATKAAAEPARVSRAKR